MRSILSPKILGEFLGTCFLVMVVIGSGIMASKLSDDELTVLLANTIATGAGLTALIWVFISISGAHFNPAVTLVMFMKNEIQVLLMLLFIGTNIADDDRWKNRIRGYIQEAGILVLDEKYSGKRVW